MLFGMLRKARTDAPGKLHHLITQGIERDEIFRDDADRNYSIEPLGLVSITTRAGRQPIGRMRRKGGGR